MFDISNNDVFIYKTCHNFFEKNIDHPFTFKVYSTMSKYTIVVKIDTPDGTLYIDQTKDSINQTLLSLENSINQTLKEWLNLEIPQDPRCTTILSELITSKHIWDRQSIKIINPFRLRKHFNTLVEKKLSKNKLLQDMYLLLIDSPPLDI